MRFAGGAAGVPPGTGARPGDTRATASSRDKAATAITATPESLAAPHAGGEGDGGGRGEGEDGEDGENEGDGDDEGGGVASEDRFMPATRMLGDAPSPSYGEPARRSNPANLVNPVQTNPIRPHSAPVGALLALRCHPQAGRSLPSLHPIHSVHSYASRVDPAFDTGGGVA